MTRSAIAAPSDDERALEPAGERGRTSPSSSPRVVGAVVHAGSRDTRFAHDTGRDGEPPALPRRADADHRQARRACRAQGPEGRKGGASLEDYFDALRFGLPRLPALAHRLDKETSGCLVLGRHRKALADLSLLFRNGKVGKTYWAVVEGGPEADEGRIDMPLGRLDDTRGWWMKHDPDGLPSQTTWKVMGRARRA